MHTGSIIELILLVQIFSGQNQLFFYLQYLILVYLNAEAISSNSHQNGYFTLIKKKENAIAVCFTSLFVLNYYVRMTLLLGPPSSGKTTLMRVLTGKPAKNLKVSYLFI